MEYKILLLENRNFSEIKILSMWFYFADDNIYQLLSVDIYFICNNYSYNLMFIELQNASDKNPDYSTLSVF